MTELGSISPARYWRDTKNWSKLLGKTGTVLAATLVQFGLPELEASSPYWLVLIKYDDPSTDPSRQIFVGVDGFAFKENERVVCVLKRFSSPGDGLIHYGIKVSPAKI